LFILLSNEKKAQLRGEAVPLKPSGKKEFSYWATVSQTVEEPKSLIALVISVERFN
jgi:hypothetical protein